MSTAVKGLQRLKPSQSPLHDRRREAASIGDYLSQKHVDGGLGLGTTGTSALFLTAIAGVIAYLTITRRDANETLQPAPA